MQNQFTRETWVPIGEVRAAIKRRAVVGSESQEILQIGGHGYPTRIGYGFIDYDDAGNWRSIITVWTQAVDSNRIQNVRMGGYFYRTWKQKTQMTVLVEVPKSASRNDLARATAQAKKLARQLSWEGFRIRHERQGRAVPVGKMRYWSDATDVSTRQRLLETHSLISLGNGRWIRDLTGREGSKLIQNTGNGNRVRDVAVLSS